MFSRGGGSEASPVASNPGVHIFLASQKVIFDEKILGGKGLRPDLETLQVDFLFNSSESVFRVKNGGWFFVTRRGGGQSRFDICHKKSGFFK